MARHTPQGLAVDLADKSLPPERRILNDLATQILAASAEARKVKADKAAGVDRCPERTEALDISASEAHHRDRQERLRIGAPVGIRAVGQWSQAPTHGERVRTQHNAKKTQFNLKGVVEILEEQGYSPVHAIVSILQGVEDAEAVGGVRYLVDHDVRLKAAGELMKFAYPTKKAVEIKDTTPPRSEEIDRKLGELLGRYVSILGPGGTLPYEVREAASLVIHDARLIDDDDEDGEPFDPMDML